MQSLCFKLRKSYDHVLKLVTLTYFNGHQVRETKLIYQCGNFKRLDFKPLFLSTYTLRYS